MKDPELWARLIDCAFPLENDKTTLRRRLMAKTGLGAERVDRVIDEYRRFLYLAAIGPMAVPSKLVDFVWHMHIEDTRAYDEFCKAVIGKFIHHSPGRPSQSDDLAYPETLKAYASEFGAEPFWRIWPRPAELVSKRLSDTGKLITLGSGFAAVVFTPTYAWIGLIPGLVLLGIGYLMAPWSALSLIGGSDGAGCGSGDSGCGGDGGGCGGD